MERLNNKYTIRSFFESSSISKESFVRVLLNSLNILGILLTIYGIYWGYKHQIFTSEDALRNLLERMGSAAPIGFILIQIIQTVVPIIPAALTIPMGALIFGMGYGFYLNFIGIMIGSIINFILARKLGRPFVELLVDQNKFQKYTRWLDDEKRFNKIFTFGMFFPLSPADLLCYIAGLSKISFRRYLITLSLGKPLTLFLYSFGTSTLLNLAFQAMS